MDILIRLRAYGLFVDGETILPMLRPSGLRAGDSDPLHPGSTLSAADAERRYTCEHFDRASGNCMIYERRPGMCREYPINGCRIEGCTFTEEARA